MNSNNGSALKLPRTKTARFGSTNEPTDDIDKDSSNLSESSAIRSGRKLNFKNTVEVVDVPSYKEFNVETEIKPAEQQCNCNNCAIF
jgi:hypothetical protein